ncbi:MAG TPA: hypothetical protein VH092_37820 [Urbifossiella sp.]|jgi:hypothetical protein|nr:hypothetical protein [Urbifossiella sp.]
MTLTCPKCLEEHPVRLDVADGVTLTCGGCEEEYTAAAVRRVVDSWLLVLPRLEAFAPTEASS